MVQDYDEKVSEMEIQIDNMAAMNDLAAGIINNLQQDAENMKISINEFVAEIRRHYLENSFGQTFELKAIIEKHFDVSFETGKM